MDDTAAKTQDELVEQLADRIVESERVVVFTGAGNRAFCTGGNTAQYGEYCAGRPE